MGARRTSTYLLCEECKCFRSDHPRGGACRNCGKCPAFKFTPQVKAKATLRRWTAEEVDRAKAMLEGGATYAEVGRRLDRSPAAVLQKLPGYGHNAKRGDIQDGRVAFKAANDKLDAAYEARRAIRRAERVEAGYQRDGGCSFEGCDGLHYAHGLCHPHYDQNRHQESLRPIQSHRDKPCQFDGCDGRNFSRGLCRSHASQRDRGRELTPIRRRS